MSFIALFASADIVLLLIVPFHRKGCHAAMPDAPRSSIHRSAWKVNSRKFDGRRSKRGRLLGTSSLEGQPHRSIPLVPPRVADAYVLHDRIETVPHHLAVVTLQPQHARDLLVEPSLDDHLCVLLTSFVFAQVAPHRDRVPSHCPCYSKRLVSQLFPARRELAAEEPHVVVHCQILLLKVGDRGEDEGRCVALGGRQEFFCGELCIGRVGHRTLRSLSAS